jgi:hypothetical protein
LRVLGESTWCTHAQGQDHEQKSSAREAAAHDAIFSLSTTAERPPCRIIFPLVAAAI